MKKFFFAFLSTILLLQSCEYDDSELRGNITDLQERVTKLELVCKELNTNVTALQTIVQALNSRDYVVNVSSIYSEGSVIGYSITLFYGGTFTIYNGKDGVDGYVPNIGVAMDVDGIYYWTLDGKWLLDVNGEKVKASGIDGKNGTDGTDGTNGKDGVDGTDGTDGTNGKDGVDGTDGKDGSDGNDGITPRLKIENNYWYISYNNGVDWEILGKATGNDGINGDNLFDSVTQDDTYVYFNLADGTIITLPKQDKRNIQFEDLVVKSICCKYWDQNNDGELSYDEAASVTSLENAFWNNSDIIAFNELRFFTNLNIIDYDDFVNCSSLWKITFPENLTELSGFTGCSSLTSIIIPKNVTKLGSFDGCTGMKSIILECHNLKNYYQPFEGCSGVAHIDFDIPSSLFSGADITSVVMGDNVKEIADSAFLGCDEIKNLVLGKNVEVIGKHAFASCGKLENLTIGDKIKSIGEEAFIVYTNARKTKNFYIESATPPAVGTRAFYYRNYNNTYNTYSYGVQRGLKIYVPDSSLDLWKTQLTEYESILFAKSEENEN